MERRLDTLYAIWLHLGPWRGIDRLAEKFSNGDVYNSLLNSVIILLYVNGPLHMQVLQCLEIDLWPLQQSVDCLLYCQKFGLQALDQNLEWIPLE